MIEIKNLYKSFNGTPVLQGVDLEIANGKSIAIIGRSGCGKSVLLKHILGLIRPDSGSVTIDGEDLGSMKYDEISRIRKKFGILFQSAALFDSMTVGENIALPLERNLKLPPGEVNDRVEEALELVGLPGSAGLKPAELSGGMKKRAGLARAIVYKPQYILYDEPTTGLDPIMAANINQLIVDLNTRLEITSVVVTHDIVSANFVADEIVMLHYGKILTSGTPEEIQHTDHPTVKQFIEGNVEGPIKPFQQYPSGNSKGTLFTA